MDDLFDLSLLAAYESLGEPPVASAWVDLYRTAVLRSASRGLKARLRPEAALAEAISSAVDHATAAMPAPIGARVSAVAIAQVQYLAARHRVTRNRSPRTADGSGTHVRSETVPRDVSELHHLGERLYELVLRAADDGAVAMGSKELARLLGEPPAWPEVAHAVDALAGVGWLKKRLWGVKPGRLAPGG